MNSELRVDIIKTAALLGLFSVLFISLPLINVFVYVIWPIPIVWFILKHNENKAFIVILLAAFINMLFAGATMGASAAARMAVFSIAGYSLIGFSLGSALKEKFGPLKTLVLTIITALIANIIAVYISSYISETISALKYFITAVDQGQLPADTAAFLREVINQNIAIFKKVYPSYIATASIGHGILTYYLTINFLQDREINGSKLKIQGYKAFKDWTFPRWLPLLFGLLYILQLAGLTGGQGISSIIMLNALIIIGFFVFLQGLSVIVFYLSKKKSIPLYIAAAILILILYFLVIVIGLIEPWFSLRKDNRKEERKDKE